MCTLSTRQLAVAAWQLHAFTGRSGHINTELNIGEERTTHHVVVVVVVTVTRFYKTQKRERLRENTGERREKSRANILSKVVPLFYTILHSTCMEDTIIDSIAFPQSSKKKRTTNQPANEPPLPAPHRAGNFLSTAARLRLPVGKFLIARARQIFARLMARFFFFS